MKENNKNLIKEFNVKRFYRPEFYERRETFEVDYRKIDKLFENFLKRSYISYLNYEKLQNLGLNRIEQFVICLAFILFKGYSNSDNLIIDNKVYKIEKIEKIRTVKIKNKQIDFLKCLENRINRFNKKNKKIRLKADFIYNCRISKV